MSPTKPVFVGLIIEITFFSYELSSFLTTLCHEIKCKPKKLKFHRFKEVPYFSVKMSEDKSVSETDAQGEKIELDYDQVTTKGEITVKVICLGDSAVGKSK